MAENLEQTIENLNYKNKDAADLMSELKKSNQKLDLVSPAVKMNSSISDSKSDKLELISSSKFNLRRFIPDVFRSSSRSSETPTRRPWWKVVFGFISGIYARCRIFVRKLGNVIKNAVFKTIKGIGLFFKSIFSFLGYTLLGLTVLIGSLFKGVFRLITGIGRLFKSFLSFVVGAISVVVSGIFKLISFSVKGLIKTLKKLTKWSMPLFKSLIFTRTGMYVIGYVAGTIYSVLLHPLFEGGKEIYEKIKQVKGNLTWENIKTQVVDFSTNLLEKIKNSSIFKWIEDLAFPVLNFAMANVDEILKNVEPVKNFINDLTDTVSDVMRNIPAYAGELVGGAVGGAVGQLIGSYYGGQMGRVLGAILGGAIGGGLGNLIGRLWTSNVDERLQTKIDFQKLNPRYSQSGTTTAVFKPVPSKKMLETIKTSPMGQTFSSTGSLVKKKGYEKIQRNLETAMEENSAFSDILKDRDLNLKLREKLTSSKRKFDNVQLGNQNISLNIENEVPSKRSKQDRATMEFIKSLRFRSSLYQDKSEDEIVDMFQTPNFNVAWNERNILKERSNEEEKKFLKDIERDFNDKKTGFGALFLNDLMDSIKGQLSKSEKEIGNFLEENKDKIIDEILNIDDLNKYIGQRRSLDFMEGAPMSYNVNFPFILREIGRKLAGFIDYVNLIKYVDHILIPQTYEGSYQTIGKKYGDTVFPLDKFLLFNMTQSWEESNLSNKNLFKIYSSNYNSLYSSDDINGIDNVFLSLFNGKTDRDLINKMSSSATFFSDLANSKIFNSFETPHPVLTNLYGTSMENRIVQSFAPALKKRNEIDDFHAEEEGIDLFKDMYLNAYSNVFLKEMFGVKDDRKLRDFIKSPKEVADKIRQIQNTETIEKFSKSILEKVSKQYPEFNYLFSNATYDELALALVDLNKLRKDTDLDSIVNDEGNNLSQLLRKYSEDGKYDEEENKKIDELKSRLTDETIRQILDKLKQKFIERSKEQTAKDSNGTTIIVDNQQNMEYDNPAASVTGVASDNNEQASFFGKFNLPNRKNFYPAFMNW